MEASRKIVQENEMTVVHTKGHQDRQTKKLTMLAKINIEADKQALLGYEKSIERRATPGHRASLTINGNLITAQYDTEIRRAYTSPDMRTYLQRKHDFDDTALNLIDWDAIGSFLASLPLCQRIRTTKFIHNWLPTKEKLSRLTNAKDECLCGSAETHHHLLICPLREKESFDFISTLDRQLKKRKPQVIYVS